MGIGNKIGELCEKRGISLRYVAMKAGIPYTTLYSAVKRDSSGMDADTLQKIAQALDVDVHQLLKPVESEDGIKSPGSVGKRLALVRQSRGMSRELLADQAGISVEQLEQIENGTLIAPFELQYEFCRILEMDYRWLSCGENTEAHDKMMEKVLGPGDTFSVDADSEDAIRKDIMESFSKLNHDGMMEARKRIAELAQLLCYQVKASRETKEREELQKEKDAHKE